MTKTIQGYSAKEPKAPLTPITYEANPLSHFDVHIEITHCGICHSDVHLIDDDWAFSEYPLVPGHEIVGIVQDKGDHVDFLEIGERVGIGWQGASCMRCEWCQKGDENLCADNQPTCNGRYGGFATDIIADARFAFPIPEEIPSAYAAPLLCGGATVFSPFISYGIKPTDRVAVTGIGGLGHLALQFAHAMGCNVTALSSTKEKEAEARKFGADHFVCTDAPEALEDLARSFDFILSSSTHGLDWPAIIKSLRPRGKICLLGALEQDVQLEIVSLVDGQKTVCGSNIGSRPQIKQMLAFAALHNIRPQIEEFPLKDVNKAIEKLKSGKMRYRAVLVNDNA